MKKLLSALVVLSLVVAASAAFAADKADLPVNLTVLQYATVETAGTVAFDFDPAAGSTTAEIPFSYKAGANYDTTVAYSLAKEALPGYDAATSWSAAPASIKGNVHDIADAKLTLTGLDLTVDADTYTDTIVITIQ